MSTDIVTNRRAFIAIQSWKSWRRASFSPARNQVDPGRLANLNNAFARIEKGGIYLYDSDIQPYVRASHTQHEPKRPRKLLLHKSEIQRLFEPLP